MYYVAVLVFTWAPALVLAAVCTDTLQSDGKHHYHRITGKLTTCSDITHGVCPIAVPAPDFPCLVSCVAEEADCAKVNPQAAFINPFVDPNLCVPCEIAACSRCIYTSADSAPVCQQCYPSFTLRGGGITGTECRLWNSNLILLITWVIYGIVAFLTLLVIAGTLWGWCRSLRRSTSLTEPLVPARNKEAIGHGLKLSVEASIKIASWRQQSRHTMPADTGLTRRILHATFSSKADDLGVGLQLFFNTQGFLILTCAVIWLVAFGQSEWQGQFQNFNGMSSDECIGLGNKTSDIEVRLSQTQLSYAKTSQVGCVILWLAVMLLSWAFHYYQKLIVLQYDAHTASSEDYTLKLEGLPTHLMSERSLKAVLETELRMEGKLHGVCICYDMKSLKGELLEEIENMLERLTEFHDLENGWCDQSFTTPREELEAALAEDAKEFARMLQEGEIKASGIAFVVFKTQNDMVRIARERKGILKSILPKSSEQLEVEESEVKEGMSPQTPWMRKLLGLRRDWYTGQPDPNEMVLITHSEDEPAGLKFHEMAETSEVLKARNLKLPARMIFYIAAYWAVAQLFYRYMVEPFQNRFIESDKMADGGAVKAAGNFVVLFNVAMQTAVMMDVETIGGFVKFSKTSQYTLVWNSMLLLVTNGYIIMQECYRNGVRWSLVQPTEHGTKAFWEWQLYIFQAARTESDVGKSLKDVITDQILMLYILGEIANVLAPVLINWLALRLIFVYNVGGAPGSRVQKLLRGMLPRSQSETMVTPREAEKAQVLVPQVLWMEYTYIFIFPAMALCSFYVITDETPTICAWLLGFSVLFYIWQRYVMLWLYGKTTYDSADTYRAFIVLWGLVVSMIPPGFAFWAYRLGQIQEGVFAALMVVLIFLLAYLIYLGGFLAVESLLDSDTERADPGDDKGYINVMERSSASWWNLNPIYVLKNQFCPELPGFEVHTDVPCWPSCQKKCGLLELGKEFRHEVRSDFERTHHMLLASRSGIL